MKIEVAVWEINTAKKVISAVETPQLNYDPQKGVFGVPTRDADYYYEIQSQMALKPRIIIANSVTILIFDKEAEARAFTTWLMGALAEAR